MDSTSVPKLWRVEESHKFLPLCNEETSNGLDTQILVLLHLLVAISRLNHKTVQCVSKISRVVSSKMRSSLSGCWSEVPSPDSQLTPREGGRELGIDQQFEFVKVSSGLVLQLSSAQSTPPPPSPPQRETWRRSFASMEHLQWKSELRVRHIARTAFLVWFGSGMEWTGGIFGPSEDSVR
jgi:hypothetical protein